MKEQSRKNDRVEILGIELQWKLRRNDTVDQYCVLAVTMPPGAGVPVHQHPQQEAFFILEGQAEFALENGAGLAWKEVNPAAENLRDYRQSLRRTGCAARAFPR